MTWTKFLLTMTQLSVGILLAVGIPTRFFGPVQAQSQSSGSQRLIPTWGEYEPPSTIGRPGGREGGGSRGPCIRNYPNDKPIALVPLNTFGRTLAASPTFFVYLPPIQEDKTPMLRFILRTAENKEVYKTTFPATTRSAGIISFSLPAAANSPTLETGKTYKWSLTLICDPTDPSANKLVSGLIQRIAPPSPMESELVQVNSPEAKVAIYTKYGVWYDALKVIADLRRTSDNESLKNDWIALLQSVELQKIANEPLMQSATASDAETRPVSRQQ